MRFTYQELLTLHSLRRHIELWRKDVLTGQEIVNALVQDLVLADVDAIIPNCAAILAPELREILKERIAKLAADDYRGRVFFIGPGRSDEQQAELQPRFRLVAERLRESLKTLDETPESVAAFDVPEGDFFWSILQATPSNDSEICEIAGCMEPRTQLSPWCARHHYELIKGKPPPTPPSSPQG